MRLSALLIAFFILTVSMLGCNWFKPCDSEPLLNATDFGVSVTNSGEENSRNLQSLIDRLSEKGGKIYIARYLSHRAYMSSLKTEVKL